MKPYALYVSFMQLELQLKVKTKKGGHYVYSVKTMVHCVVSPNGPILRKGYF